MPSLSNHSRKRTYFHTSSTSSYIKHKHRFILHKLNVHTTKVPKHRGTTSSHTSLVHIIGTTNSQTNQFPSKGTKFTSDITDKVHRRRNHIAQHQGTAEEPSKHRNKQAKSLYYLSRGSRCAEGSDHSLLVSS